MKERVSDEAMFGIGSVTTGFSLINLKRESFLRYVSLFNPIYTRISLLNSGLHCFVSKSKLVSMWTTSVGNNNTNTNKGLFRLTFSRMYNMCNPLPGDFKKWKSKKKKEIFVLNRKQECGQQILTLQRKDDTKRLITGIVKIKCY